MAIDLGDAVVSITGDDKSLMKTVGGVAGKLGKSFTVAGGLITGALGLAAKSAMDFGTEMAAVNTLGVEDLGALSDAVKNTSATFGLDLADGAKAAYQAISAGAKEAEVPLILEKAAQAAAAGQADLTTAIELGMGTMNAMGKTTDDLEGIYNEAFIAVKKGVTTFEELGASVGKVNPLFAAAGLKSKEMFGSIAALTKGGVATAEAVTGMKAALTGVIKPASEATKVAKGLGLEFNVAALESKGLAGFMADVKEKTGGNIEVLAKLFPSVEGLNAVLALTGSQAETFADIMGEMGNSIGATQEAFDKMVEADPGFAWRQLKAEMLVLVTEIGTTLLPILKRVVDFLKPIVSSLRDWIKEHPALTKNLVLAAGAIGGLMLVLGPLLIMLPGIVAAFGVASGAVGVLAGAVGFLTGGAGLASLTFLFGPLGIALTATAFAVGAVAKGFWNLKQAKEELEASEQRLDAQMEKRIAQIEEYGVAVDRRKMQDMDFTEQTLYLDDLVSASKDRVLKHHMKKLSDEATADERYVQGLNLAKNKEIKLVEAAAVAVSDVSMKLKTELANADTERTRELLTELGIREGASKGSLNTQLDNERAAARQLDGITKESREYLKRWDLGHRESPSILDTAGASLNQMLDMVASTLPSMDSLLGQMRDMWLNTWQGIASTVMGILDTIWRGIQQTMSGLAGVGSGFFGSSIPTGGGFGRTSTEVAGGLSSGASGGGGGRGSVEININATLQSGSDTRTLLNQIHDAVKRATASQGGYTIRGLRA